MLNEGQKRMMSLMYQMLTINMAKHPETYKPTDFTILSNKIKKHFPEDYPTILQSADEFKVSMEALLDGVGKTYATGFATWKKNPIEALLKYGESQALVLDKMPVFTYKRHDNLLIGMDETGNFISCYKYEKPTGNMKAFGGREFTLPLEDGSVIECNGQWWDGGYDEAEKMIRNSIVSVPICTKESLKDTDIFYSGHMFEAHLEHLLSEYVGEVMDRKEYVTMLMGEGV